MEDFRKYISAKPEEFLRLIKDTEKAVGLPITATPYKRPKPTDNPKLEPYFAWKGNIACVREESPSEDLFSPALAQRVKEMLVKLRPLYNYFDRFKT